MACRRSSVRTRSAPFRFRHRKHSKVHPWQWLRQALQARRARGHRQQLNPIGTFGQRCRASSAQSETGIVCTRCKSDGRHLVASTRAVPETRANMQSGHPDGPCTQGGSFKPAPPQASGWQVLAWATRFFAVRLGEWWYARFLWGPGAPKGERRHDSICSSNSGLDGVRCDNRRDDQRACGLQHDSRSD